jgi:hypothetical protein
LKTCDNLKVSKKAIDATMGRFPPRETRSQQGRRKIIRHQFEKLLAGVVLEEKRTKILREEATGGVANRAA